MKAFVAEMNRRAASLGMNNTHFVTPSGLDAEEHYSTAYDMALLARAALQNPLFAGIAASRRMTVSYGQPPYARSLLNHNRCSPSMVMPSASRPALPKRPGGAWSPPRSTKVFGSSVSP